MSDVEWWTLDQNNLTRACLEMFEGYLVAPTEAN